jgi:uncharacterized protein (DUF427 family)
MEEAFRQTRGELCHEPTEKRLRAMLGDDTVVDSTSVMLVWEPRRIIPHFAVPQADIRAALSPTEAPAPDGDAPPVLHPGIPFQVHSTAGEELDVRAAGATREAAAFRPADPDLAGHVLLDFDAFDAWYEEDERIVSHPRDPFHRVDIRRSSRHVRVELDGEPIAESARPTLVFETQLPMRFYLPREDIVAELRPSARRTACAYKGEASYWTFEAGGRRHDSLLWTYEQPLPDAAQLAGLVSFFDDRFDLIVDGKLKERPRTALAAVMLEEFGVA